MQLQKVKDGNWVAFQKFVHGDKKGFIGVGESFSQALNACVMKVAKHCTATGDHPANIITGPIKVIS